MKILILIPVLCLLFLNLLCASEKSPDTFKVHKNLVYSEPGQKMTLDLFIPTGAKQPTPCIMVIQGGGFKARDGQKFRPYAEYFAQHGYAAALISYRGLPEHTYKETMADVKASVRFVRKISKKHNIDDKRIGAMGRSAGATLAILLGLSGDVKELEGEGGHAEFSSSIQAAAGIAGVYDFPGRYTSEEQRVLQPKIDTKIKSNGAWIGAAFAPDNEEWLRSSAKTHVDKNDPPILLLHCKGDKTVPWMQSRDMHQAMRAAGGKSEAHIVEGGGHGGPAKSNELMLKFFNKELRKQQSK